MLGKLYSETDFEQSEKVLASAYLIASKCENQTFALASGQMLVDAFKRNEKADKIIKQESCNELHRQKLHENIAFSTSTQVQE